MDSSYQKKILICVFFINLIIICSSCKRSSWVAEADCPNYNYSDCNTQEPVHADIILKLTINSENTSVPIFIYEGFIEDNILVYSDTVSTNEYKVSLPINQYYSAKAMYKKNNLNIIAVGGDKVEKIATRVCDSVCWSTKEGQINITLKD